MTSDSESESGTGHTIRCVCGKASESLLVRRPCMVSQNKACRKRFWDRKWRARATTRQCKRKCKCKCNFQNQCSWSCMHCQYRWTNARCKCESAMQMPLVNIYVNRYTGKATFHSSLWSNIVTFVVILHKLLVTIGWVKPKSSSTCGFCVNSES